MGLISRLAPLPWSLGLSARGNKLELAGPCRLLGSETLLVHLGPVTSSDRSHPILLCPSILYLGSLSSWVSWPAASSLVPTPEDLGVGHGQRG